MIKKTKQNRYSILLESIFFDHYDKKGTPFIFDRSELETKAIEIGINLPKNIGDIIYSFRYRNDLPSSILATQPENLEWIIEGAGKAKYRFKLVSATKITPNKNFIKIKIPDATPEIIRNYTLDDEQALLAIIRYNRLIDTFLGLTTYSLQNHLRTTVKGIGQIEIDELYVGLDKNGCHFVIPVQAKAGADQIGIVQTMQDIAFVAQRYPKLKCRAISAQFLPDETVAMFELTVHDDQVLIVSEKHYKLLPYISLDNSIHNYKD